jgi:hypothetical protein
MRNIQHKLGVARGEAPAVLLRILILPVRHAPIQDYDQDQEQE